MPESISFDRVAAEYDATRGGEVRGRAHANVLSPLLPSAGAVLEIGVGTGVVALAMRDRGHDVVGVDISSSMLARARRRIGQRIALGDATRLPVATAGVAAAYSVWVYHLIGDRSLAFEEAHRVVASGGRYAVVGSNLRSPEQDELGGIMWRLRRSVRGSLPDADEPEELARLAVAAGWQVESSDGFEGEEHAETPREVRQRVESRSWSWLWPVDAATWDRSVVPALRELDQLGDPDRARVRRSTENLLVLRRG